MTNWFDSTSLKNTSWPVSGHLIQRFSGDSRRLRKLRILGRTTLEIQFMALVFVSRSSWAKGAKRRLTEEQPQNAVVTNKSRCSTSKDFDALHKAGHDELKLWRFFLCPAHALGE